MYPSVFFCFSDSEQENSILFVFYEYLSVDSMTSEGASEMVQSKQKKS